MLDQWEFRDRHAGDNKKELWHIPCNMPVHRAVNGPTWVCQGCFLQPPPEMLDVILLGMNEVWKGWVDLPPFNPGFSGFYFGPSTNSNISHSFYYTVEDLDAYFYIGYNATKTSWVPE
jgi:hypothetical protein